MKIFKTSISQPVTFISGGHFISDKPWTHSKRTIDSFEVIIGANKTLYMSQDGIKYEVKPGDVLLILPFTEHEGYQTSEVDLSFYWFHFYCPLGYCIIDNHKLREDVCRINQRQSTSLTPSDQHAYLPLFFTPTSIERINIMFRQLLHVYRSNYYSSIGGHYLTTSILIELTEQAITSLFLPSYTTEGEKNLNTLLEWIRVHALEDLSISDIADKFNYSREYLSRYFKKHTGMTLLEYLHTEKIFKAKEYLARTDDTIKEIAYHVGFTDEKYFMKRFKKMEGMTPSEYRASYFRTKMNKQ